jgi:hypothetical protein
MMNLLRSLPVGAAVAMLLAAAPAARAQDTNSVAAPPPAPAPAVGNPQLRDFQLTPQRRIVTQPAPQAPAPVVAAPPPVTAQPTRTAPTRQAEARPSTPASARQPAAVRPQPSQAAPVPAVALPPPAPVALPPRPAPTPATAPQSGGFPWLYALPVAALALLAFAWLRRRRRLAVEVERADPAPAPVAAPPAPRPEPVPRPWLELTLKAERASATLTETMVQFELEIANTGKSPARNLRIDVKMFNAGAEQDKEIGAFFRTAGRETTKLNLPGIGPDSVGVIRGEVAMPRDEMRAVVLEDKYLFIPVIAVNALYDWGDGRTGQTSRSYIVGRELQQPSEKMGAFRVDQGPRIWRTVGQRPHTLAKRV